MSQTDMKKTARDAAQLCLKKGAREAAARAYRIRDIELTWRDGKVEKIQESTTRGLGLSIYVDGRYSSVTTSDLRPDALDTFVADSIALARTLAVDPHRALPDPALYKGQASLDLKLEDPKYATVTPEERRKLAQSAEAAARAVKGASSILSVTTSFNDTQADSFLFHTNGFEGSRRDTSFWVGAQVSVKDADGRRPEDYSYGGSRFYGELPSAARCGTEGAERALSRLGAKKGESGLFPLVVENRAAGRLVSYLNGPLSAGALQQKRSFLEGKVGQAIGSPKLHVTDDPHLVKGFGSRLYDGEGLAARPMPVFENGVLRNYYVDTYYGKKLGMAPTTAGASNLAWKLGDKGRDALISGIQDGLYVTGFIGGNSNSLTGDFSLGFQGFRIRKGALAEAVAEMNVSGNHLELWKKLVDVGNDPYPYSTLRTPTLVFDGIQIAGI